MNDRYIVNSTSNNALYEGKRDPGKSKSKKDSDDSSDSSTDSEVELAIRGKKEIGCQF